MKGAKTRRKKWWHTWFAWYPVRVPNEVTSKTVVWLEKIERKGKIKYFYDEGQYWQWEYKLKNEDK
jgi:hypothetical protein